MYIRDFKFSSMSMSPWISTIVVEYGIPFQTVILLLLFPLVATLVAFFRQVIGVKAFGIYTLSIIALVFFMISDAQYDGFDLGKMFYDLRYGIAIYIAVIAIAMAMRVVMQRFRLLYFPRVAITMTVVSFTVLGILALGGFFQRTGFATVYAFPLIVLVVIAEKFVSVQIEKGTKTAILLALETLIVGLFGYAFLSSEVMWRLVMEHPWVPLLAIPANILLGKWTGLRALEYIRFRDVIARMK